MADPREVLRCRRLSLVWGLLVSGLLIVAAALRWLYLASIRPGLHFDEAVYGLMARGILGGQRPVFFSAYTGREPLYMYVMALVMAVVGSRAFAIRLTSAAIGVVTIALGFTLGRALYGRRVAFAAAALMAVSYWHLTVSRNGYPNILIPPIEAMSAFFLWRAWQCGRRRDWLLGGAFTALVLYTYLAARFWPLCVALFAVYGLVVEPPRRRERLAGLLIAAGSALAVAAPLAWHFYRVPADFWERANQVLAWRQLQGLELVRAYAANTLRTLAGFVAQGHGRWHFNLPGRSVFGPIVRLLAIAGLAIALRRLRHPRYGLSVIWVGVMCLPGILTLEMQPASQRMFGAFPALVFFPAIGLVAASELAARIVALPGLSGAIAVGLALAIGVVDGARTVRDYFFVWARRPETALVFNADYVEMARLAGQDRKAGRLPVILSEHYKHPTIAFLAPELVDGAVWADPRLALPLPARAAMAIYYRPTSWLADDAPASRWLEAEASQRTAFEVGPAADKAPRASDEVPLAVIRYVVPWREHWRAQVDDPGFAGEVAVRPGEPIVRTARDDPAVMEVDWSVRTAACGGRGFALHLADAAGITWAQADASGYLSEQWHTGDQVWQWFTFQLDRTMPPGRYSALLMMVDASGRTMRATTPAGDAASLPVGTLVVTDEGRRRLKKDQRCEIVLEGALAVVARDRVDARLAPGATVDAGIMWARLGTGPAPDQLAFRLSAQDVTTTVLRVPIAAAYPPSRWEDREMLQGRYRIRVPAALADGTYQLSALPSGSSAAIDLGRITVRGGQRRYETQRSDYPVAADFASGLRLRGVDVAPERPQAGLPLTLTLQWQALRGGLDDGTVFVHVYDQEGRLVAQHDGVPAAGERPLPGWLPGEVVMDSHVIRLPAELANGSYRLAVGVYDPASGRRWPCESVGLPTAADAVSLPVELYRGPGGLVIQGSYEDDQVP